MRDILDRFRRRRAAAAPTRTHAHVMAQELEPRLLLAAAPTTFAVIGDYGFAAGWDAEVASLVKGWDPDLVLTVGDNNYPSGSAATIDFNIGRLYHDYIYNYRGIYGPGSPTRRFMPALGNHDWGEPLTNADGVDAYTNYFDLPGNERYYDFAAGNVHFFALDSDRNEPDGISSDSIQAHWLKGALAAATEPWKIVYFHHPPYSSGFFHGSDMALRWPFKGWGASAVLSGHDHDYERLDVDGLPYFVDGLGGGPRTGFRGMVSPFSEARFDGGYGAMRVEATDESLHFEFVATEGRVVDSYTLGRPGAAQEVPAPPSALSARGASDARVDLTWADNSDDETGFEIERSDDGGWRFDRLTTVDAGVTAYADRTVSPETTYQYRVRAVNAAGASSVTLPVAARTLAAVPVVPAGSIWKYLADGSDPGAAWRAPEFDDSGWPSGAAQLGYGDGHESTVVPYGPSLDNRFVTTYFRRTFTAPAALPAPAALRLRTRVDDGAIVYLNGQELARSNMPAGEVSYLTRAAHPLALYEDQEWRELDLPVSVLRAGANVLAVEVHQYGTSRYTYGEPDMIFDLGLIASVDDTPPAPPPPPTDPPLFPALLAGRLYSDANLDGRYGAGDAPLAGWQVYLDANSNGAPDPAERTATTNEEGIYTFPGLGPGTYDVRPVPRPDWNVTGGPSGGEYVVTVGAGQTAGGYDFAVARTASISGYTLLDGNGNGYPGVGDAAAPGRTVFLDLNDNAQPDAGEPATVSNAGGAFAFTGLEPGSYFLRALLPAGWRPTIPMESSVDAVVVGPGEASRSHFLAGTPIIASPGGPYSVSEGGSIAVTAAGSMTAGSMIRWYEWDFDYDGATFTPDTARSASPNAVFSAAGVDGTDNGSARAVAVRVYDDIGNPAIGVTTLQVSNVAPVVDAGPDARLLIGQTFASSGSFADPGPDAWTATVDWGDGAGPQPLPLGPDKRFALQHLYGAPGTYAVTVAVSDDDGGVGSTTLVVMVAAPGVTGRHLFYNRSAYDRFDGAVGPADDNAVAPDKRALLPGEAASFANVSGYGRGINGLMVDLARPAGAGDVSMADFVFEIGSGLEGSGWQPAPAPAQLAVRGGAGTDGADRVSIAWRDGAVRNTWLRVTVLANDRTGLARDDVFYFGSLAGETGDATDTIADGPGVLRVSALDRAAIRQRMFSRARITSPLDVNRDGRINAFDLSVCRANQQHTLPLFVAPGTPAPESPPAPLSVSVIVAPAPTRLSPLGLRTDVGILASQD